MGTSRVGSGGMLDDRTQVPENQKLTAEFRVPRSALRAPQQRPGRSGKLLRPAYAPVPLPPTNHEKYLYRGRLLWVLMLSSLVSFGCLVASQVMLLRLSPYLWALVPFYLFTVAYYVVSLVVNAGTPDFNFRTHKKVVHAWRPARHPSVDVFLPVCGEAPHVLSNTWKNVSDLAQHYPGRVDVHVLDDSTEDVLGRMALAFGFNYLRRPNRGWFKKAGNLRHAFQRTRNDFIVILDADFAPRHDLLNELLPYFDLDPTCGIVQSPQFFRIHRGQGWLERGAGAVQELFYRSVQVSRNRHGAAICVGSCAVYRRAALDDIGGTALIGHSEDVHTGFNLRAKGWRLRYVPVVLAAGLCPADVDSFFTQQYRWCAGSMSLLGSKKFWQTPLGVRERFSYLSGFCYYVHTAVFTFAAPILPIVLLAALPQAIVAANYILLVPSVIYNFVIFPRWHRTRFGFEAFTVKLLYGWAHAFAIVDILRRRPMGWQPTGAKKKTAATKRLWRGLRVWTCGVGVVWVGLAAFRMLTMRPVDFVAVFATGVFFLVVGLIPLLVDPHRDTEVIL